MKKSEAFFILAGIFFVMSFVISPAIYGTTLAIILGLFTLRKERVLKGART